MHLLLKRPHDEVVGGRGGTHGGDGRRCRGGVVETEAEPAEPQERGADGGGDSGADRADYGVTEIHWASQGLGGALSAGPPPDGWPYSHGGMRAAHGAADTTSRHPGVIEST